MIRLLILCFIYTLKTFIHLSVCIKKKTYRSCTQAGGNRVASKTPCHGSAGTGFRNLNRSTGGFANGTPLNTCTSRPSTLTERPRIGPELVCTTSRSIIPKTDVINCAHTNSLIIDEYIIIVN